MKVCVIQPHYSFDEKDLDTCEKGILDFLSKCDPSLDVIVLPEYSDALADVKGKDGFYEASEKYGSAILEKAVETAKRCSALVFVNCGYKTESGIRNTTHVIGKDGNVIGRYFKSHPAPSEVKTDANGGHELDVAYSYDYSAPYVLDIEGVRYAFLTCYDFYFYENFARIALENVDVIIGCSLQRTDTHDALEIINRFLCYNSNAYLIRSSVSLGEDSNVCGCSMVVAPDGSILANMKNQVGIEIVEFDPSKKYYKPSGFGGKPSSHPEYVDKGRNN